MLITNLIFIFKNFCWSYFLGEILSHHLKFYKLAVILYRSIYVVVCLLQFNVYFLKTCQSYNFGQIWSQNLMFSKLTEIWYKGILLYANCGFMCIFLKYLLFINFWRELHPKICCCPYLLKFNIEIWQTYIT